MMQIEQLGYFIEVVKKGSINLACESLHISQQALSQSMRNLEKELGLELMMRSHKGIILTEKGRLLFEGASEIVEHWEVLQADLHEDWLSGELDVSIAPLLEDYYYTKLLAYIEKHHVHIQLKVINLQVKEAIVALESNQIDLAALCFLNKEIDKMLVEHPELEFLPKKQIKATVLLSKQSTLAKKTVICISDLVDQCCIVEKNVENDFKMYRKILKKTPTDMIIEVNSFYAKQKMVADNLGFALNIENGPTLHDCDNKMVNIPLEGVEPLISGILFRKNTNKEKLLKEILNAW